MNKHVVLGDKICNLLVSEFAFHTSSSGISDLTHTSHNLSLENTYASGDQPSYQETQVQPIISDIPYFPAIETNPGSTPKGRNVVESATESIQTEHNSVNRESPLSNESVNGKEKNDDNVSKYRIAFVNIKLPCSFGLTALFALQAHIIY